jgi:hypothetical protein
VNSDHIDVAELPLDEMKEQGLRSFIVTTTCQRRLP